MIFEHGGVILNLDVKGGRLWKVEMSSNHGPAKVSIDRLTIQDHEPLLTLGVARGGLAVCPIRRPHRPLMREIKVLVEVADA